MLFFSEEISKTGPGTSQRGGYQPQAAQKRGFGADQAYEDPYFSASTVQPQEASGYNEMSFGSTAEWGDTSKRPRYDGYEAQSAYNQPAAQQQHPGYQQAQESYEQPQYVYDQSYQQPSQAGYEQPMSGNQPYNGGYF